MTGRPFTALATLLLAAGTACGGGSTGSTSARTASSTISPPVLGATTAPPPAAAAAAESIQRKLVEEQRKRTPDLVVGAAACPDGAPSGAAGASVVCTLVVEGVAVPFTVTLLGADAASLGGAESYEFHLARPMVNVVELVAGIRTQAADQLKVAPERVVVDCGAAKVQLVDIGGSVACTVNDGRTTRRLAAVVNDADGSTTVNEV